METAEMLERQIQVQLEEIATLQGEERTEATRALKVLYDMKLDALRAENERLRDYEAALEAKKLRRANIATTVGTTAASVGTTLFFMKKGFEFEKTGVYCSTTFRQLLSKLLTVVKR